jgi:hypothetical protein
MRPAGWTVAAVILVAGGAAIWSYSTGTAGPPERAVTAEQAAAAHASDVAGRVVAQPRRPSLPVPEPRSRALVPANAKSTEGGDTQTLTAEERARVRAWNEKAAEYLYGDLEWDLGFTPQQAESVRALAVERLTRGSEHQGEITQQMMDEERQSTQRFRDEVAALLDPEANAKFQEYQRSIDARAHIEWIRVMLEEARLPLSEAQRRRFIRESVRNGAFIDESALPNAPFDATAYSQDLMVRGEQRDALLLRSAGGVLDGRQLAKLAAFFKERHDALNTSIYVGN